jgi:Holliday junction resolvasome RuvABC endonuclease subunit
MKLTNKDFLEKYFANTNKDTSIGEHLFAINILLKEIVKNTSPIIMSIEDKLKAKADELKEDAYRAYRGN